MGERSRSADATERLRQGFAQVAQDHVVAVGHAIRVRGNVPVEDEDLAPRQDGPEVIERAPVAEAELEHGSGHVFDQTRGELEAVALRLEAADDGVEPAHGEAVTLWTRSLDIGVPGGPVRMNSEAMTRQATIGRVSGARRRLRAAPHSPRLLRSRFLPKLPELALIRREVHGIRRRPRQSDEPARDVEAGEVILVMGKVQVIHESVS
jgi:hypothetical protein